MRIAFLAAVLITLPAGAQARQQASGGDTPEPGQSYIETIPGTDVSFEMVYIPGGTFVMGSPEGEAGREEDEGPQRVVRIDPFWMSTREVTEEEFAIFRFRDRDNDSTAAGGTYSADAATRPSPPYEDPAHGMGEGAEAYPAVGMTQWAALQYARWLTDKTGHFYRLPSEAEWEYACQAGSTTAFSFGDDPAGLDAYAWYWDNSDEVFHAVGTKEPNAWGLYDMHGNVAEWTLDEYDPGFYASLPEDTAHVPWAEPTRLYPRTVRGGAYDDDPEALRCAARLESSLNWKRRDPQIPKSYWWNTDSPFVGFRLVRPAEPPTQDEIDLFWMQTIGL
jgi:formylglycine-generating enzyme required for sulfatase activity